MPCYAEKTNNKDDNNLSQETTCQKQMSKTVNDHPFKLPDQNFTDNKYSFKIEGKRKIFFKKERFNNQQICTIRNNKKRSFQAEGK